MVPLTTFESFEYISMAIKISNFERFLLTTFLEEATISAGNLVILGDFNSHVDNKQNVLATRFLTLLVSFNLKQHVTDSTHLSYTRLGDH